jgi:hypothetical protein
VKFQVFSYYVHNRNSVTRQPLANCTARSITMWRHTARTEQQQAPVGGMGRSRFDFVHALQAESVIAPRHSHSHSHSPCLRLPPVPKGDRRMLSSGRWRRVALARTEVSEERIAFIIRVKRIDKLGTTLTVTSNRSTLPRNSMLTLFIDRRFLSPWWRRRYVPPKRRLLQNTRGVISQKTEFFTVTAVKTSSLTQNIQGS